MNHTRREFAALTGLFACSIGLGLTPRSVRGRTLGAVMGTTYFEWPRVATDAFAGIGEGGNSLVVVSKGEALLVDTKNAGFGPALRREALAAGPKDAVLKYVVNTHHHGDHTGGNHAFTETSALFAQEKSKPRILSQINRYRDGIKGVVAQLAKSDNPNAKGLIDEATKLAESADGLAAERFAPTETFGREKELKVGELRVMLRHFGSGHTDNDTIVHIPDLNLLHAGDLLFHQRYPYMDVAGGSISTGWIDSVAKVITLCDAKTVVIPGHGNVTNVDGLRKQIRYFEAAREAVSAAVTAGKTKEQAQALELADFKDYDRPQLKALSLGAIYDEIAGKKGEQKKE